MSTRLSDMENFYKISNLLKNNILIFLLVCTIVFLTTSCANNQIEQNSLDATFLIETIEKDNCFSDEPYLYFTSNNKNVYLYCLTRVNLYDEDTAILLDDYIINNNLTIDEFINNITSRLKLDSSLWDGGTRIYTDELDDKITNNGITIIVCNTVDDNNDIYIGNKNMKYNEGFCK